MRTEFTAGSDDHDRRLESVLRRMLPHQPLGALHKALRKGDVRLNGGKAEPETRVCQGDTVAVWNALLAPAVTPPSPAAGLPPSWIVFDGTDLLVVDKPSGLLVHTGDGKPGAPPLDERVRSWLAPAASVSLSFRPGPLHRLDRETSGLVVFSKTLVGARTFSGAVAARQVSKTYLAVLRGRLDAAQTVDTRLAREEGTRTTRPAADGDEAVTVFRPLAAAVGLTLAEVDLGTGRTHQIRAHAAELGLPLAGDTKYGGGPTPAGLDVPWLLHAWRLSCTLLPPLEAPLPAPRAAWVKKTFKISP